MGDYPTPGPSEFSADEEKAMRTARADLASQMTPSRYGFGFSPSTKMASQASQALYTSARVPRRAADEQ
jgi:hypothetical protein